MQGAVCRRVGFWFMFTTFLCLGIFLYSTKVITTRASQNPLNDELMKQNIFKNQHRTSYKYKALNRNRLGRMRNQDLWNASEKTQFQHAKRTNGTARERLVANEMGNGKEKWRQLQSEKEDEERVIMNNRWNKLPLKKPAHVADPWIWHQMVKHFPVVSIVNTYHT